MYRPITVDCQSRNKTEKYNEKYGCEGCIVYHNCTLHSNANQKLKDSAKYYKDDNSGEK